MARKTEVTKEQALDLVDSGRSTLDTAGATLRSRLIELEARFSDLTSRTAEVKDATTSEVTDVRAEYGGQAAVVAKEHKAEAARIGVRIKELRSAFSFAVGTAAEKTGK